MSVALQLGTGAGVAVQLLLGREILAGILQADRAGGALAGVVLTLVLFLAVTAVVQFAQSARSELQRIWVSWPAATPRTASSTWPPW